MTLDPQDYIELEDDNENDLYPGDDEWFDDEEYPFTDDEPCDDDEGE